MFFCVFACLPFSLHCPDVALKWEKIPEMAIVKTLQSNTKNAKVGVAKGGGEMYE